MIYICKIRSNVSINCQQINESDCVKDYINDTYKSDSGSLGYPIFLEYMRCMNNTPTVLVITNHGFIIRYANSYAYIAIETNNVFQAIRLAEFIINDFD